MWAHACQHTNTTRQTAITLSKKQFIWYFLQCFIMTSCNAVLLFYVGVQFVSMGKCDLIKWTCEHRYELGHWKIKSCKYRMSPKRFRVYYFINFDTADLSLNHSSSVDTEKLISAQVLNLKSSSLLPPTAEEQLLRVFLMFPLKVKALLWIVLFFSWWLVAYFFCLINSTCLCFIISEPPFYNSKEDGRVRVPCRSLAPHDNPQEIWESCYGLSSGPKQYSTSSISFTDVSQYEHKVPFGKFTTRGQFSCKQ